MKGTDLLEGLRGLRVWLLSVVTCSKAYAALESIQASGLQLQPRQIKFVLSCRDWFALGRPFRRWVCLHARVISVHVVPVSPPRIRTKTRPIFAMFSLQPVSLAGHGPDPKRQLPTRHAERLHCPGRPSWMQEAQAGPEALNPKIFGCYNS